MRRGDPSVMTAATRQETRFLNARAIGGCIIYENRCGASTSAFLHTIPWHIRSLSLPIDTWTLQQQQLLPSWWPFCAQHFAPNFSHISRTRRAFSWKTGLQRSNGTTFLASMNRMKMSLIGLSYMLNLLKKLFPTSSKHLGVPCDGPNINFLGPPRATRALYCLNSPVPVRNEPS